MSSEQWDPVVIRDRLRSYLADTGQDLDRALELYAWNMEVSGAVLTTAAMVEVVVRNRLDEQLVAWASARRPGRSWLDAVPLDPQGLADIRKARSRAPGAVVTGRFTATSSRSPSTSRGLPRRRR